jgi:hypothetical protein
MRKIHKSLCLTALSFILIIGGQAVTHAQNIGVPPEPSTREGRVPQAPSARRRILVNIARAVVEVLCAEYGDCRGSSNPPAETPVPGSGEDGNYLNPGIAGTGSRSAPGQRSFSFNTPVGWQTYRKQSSVTVAPPNEYIGDNLTNGVILGLFDLNGASFESGTETYVRGLVSNNKYLRRVGRPESGIVDNVPCITNRMEGQSGKTGYVEKVVVYTCRRSAERLFYVVTVNSGPNSNRYDEQNLRIAQSISFR